MSGPCLSEPLIHQGGQGEKGSGPLFSLKLSDDPNVQP